MIRTAIALLGVGIAWGAIAQEHTHEGEVGAFYFKWMQPANRMISCCNNQDCAAVSQVRHTNGQWEFLRTQDGAWLIVPNNKIENYANDARDSPDGKSHMCSNGESVYCAVLGNGM